MYDQSRYQKVSRHRSRGDCTACIKKLQDENVSTSSRLPHPTFGSRIEDYASYKGQSTCDPTAKPGVMAFRNMFLKAFPGTKDE